MSKMNCLRQEKYQAFALATLLSMIFLLNPILAYKNSLSTVKSQIQVQSPERYDYHNIWWDIPSAYLPKWYATACSANPNKCDFENYSMKYGKKENYDHFKEIGAGSFGTVYRATQIDTNLTVAVKYIKQNEQKFKIRKEVMIYEMLKENKNVNQYVDIFYDYETKQYAIVCELVDFHKVNTSSLFRTISDYDLRYYMYKLFEVLDFANSKGIIHRSVKTPNIVVDHEQRLIRLLDFGNSKFYYPGYPYGTSATYKFFRPPESLLEYGFYHYSYDIWSLGCSFAGFLFMENTFFKTDEGIGQLQRYVNVLGSEKLLKFMEEFNIKFPEDEEIIEAEKQPWSNFVDEENKRFANEDAFDLLDQMLVFDFTQRITPREALQHTYFDPVREEIENEKNNY